MSAYPNPRALSLILADLAAGNNIPEPQMAVDLLTLAANGASASSSGRILTEPLGQPTVARQLSAGAASANTALTSSCRRISIRASGAAIRYSIGSSAQTANAATSHYLADGERLDLALPTTPNLALIRAAADNGVMELTELL